MISFLSIALLASVSAASFGLQFASPDASPDIPAASSAVAAVAVVHAPIPTKPRSLTARWLDLKTLSHSERYRSAFQLGGTHLFEGAQERSLIEGKLKLDAQGRYEVGFRASSGGYFNWAYSGYTGKNFYDIISSQQSASTFYTPREGTEVFYSFFADSAHAPTAAKHVHSTGWQVALRELYFGATPVKPVTVEFGSFGIDRGLSSEITTFDEDGYLSGERIRLHDAKHLFFDEISFTNAYFGDTGTVNLFKRGSSLKKFNYRQLVTQKRVNQLIAFSGEYTWQSGISTVRQAVVLSTKQSKVVDSLRMEGYERLNSVTFAGLEQSPVGPIPSLKVNGASGFAITAERKLGRFSGDAGYASVDDNYSVYNNSRFFHAVSFALNGDSYGQGNRAFVHASVKLAPGVTAFGFFTHEVGSERIHTLNQQGLNGGVTFDLKSVLTKARVM